MSSNESVDWDVIGLMVMMVSFVVVLPAIITIGAVVGGSDMRDSIVECVQAGGEPAQCKAALGD